MSAEGVRSFEPKPIGGYTYEGTYVIVSARVAHWIATRTNLSQMRISARGTDAEIYNTLHDIHRAGLAWATTATTGSTGRKAPEAAALSEEVGTTKAAELLGISDRAVRLAIDEGRLPAERDGRKWRVKRTDIEHYRAARAA